MKLPARKRHKGSDLNTNQKLLTHTDNDFYYTANDGTAVQLSIIQQDVVITNNAAFTLSLPSVSEARGKKYTISVVNDGNAVTLTDYPNGDYHDSVDWGGDYTLDTAGDSIALQSDGQSWNVVSNDIV